MKDQYPQHWGLSELNDIFLFIDYRGKTPKKVNSGIPLITAKNVRPRKINQNPQEFMRSEDYTSWMTRGFPKVGDILFTTEAPLAYAALINISEQFAIAQRLICLQPYSRQTIDTSFYMYALLSPKIQEIIYHQGTGSTAKGIKASRLKKIQIPTPPYHEQKRIAVKLDCLLAKVDACKARLEKVPDILKRFRQSVLADAVSGKLTEDWRRKHEKNILDWKSLTIGGICENSFYGPRFGKNEYSEVGIPTIRTTDMTENGEIVLKNPPKIEVPENRINDFKLIKGDLLITRTGSIGTMAVFNNNYLAIPSAYLIRFRFKREAIPKFVYICLKSPKGQELLGLGSTAITQPNINAKTIKSINISLPSLEEQNEIIFRVEALFIVADQFEKKLKTARSQVDRLTASILSKAFRGELVPQDPTDEPAELLLKRIRAEREALALAANKMKGGRTPKKSSGRGKRPKTKKSDAEADPEPAVAVQMEASVDEEKNRKAKFKKQPAAQFDKRFEKTEVLKAFRKAIFRQTDIDEYKLLRLVGQRLGVNRLSKQIRLELESYIRTAIRRKIIAHNGDGYDSATPTINQYDSEYLIKVFRSVIRKGYEYERGHVVTEAAEYLGFDKVSDAFAERMKAVFRLSLRRGELYRNGIYVGKS